MVLYNPMVVHNKAKNYGMEFDMAIYFLEIM